ncbi:MAG: cytidylate kinase family protein [Oligosphaeraceae bacterium]
MSILTIAREHGAWTAVAGESLAQRLGATVLDKEELERRLLEAGMKSKLFQRYDERKPGFFSSFSPDQDVYLLYLKTVMLQAAREGNVIILGRGAHLLLKDLPNCLRVRLVAPLDFRVRTIQREYGYDQETANRLVHKCDADRAGFCHFHFNEEWGDASLYDLTVNTATLTQEQLVDFLALQMQSRVGAEQEEQARPLLANRILAQKVATVLLVEQKISLAFLDVQADETGRVTLLGATTTPAAAHLAAQAARNIPGVTEVDNQIRIALEMVQPTPRI